MKLKVSISPCPNDTFMFDAMLAGRVDTEGLEFEASFADIEELNRGVIAGGPDLSKISYAVFPRIAGRYAVLDSGSALGSGNGPLLVSRDGVDMGRSGLRVAVPGQNTTANMLMDRFFPGLADRTPVLFSEVAAAVARGDFDCGVLIHEGRFTYREHGLESVADLGALWEEDSGMPLPLGAIAVSRELPPEVSTKVERVLRRSVEYAMANPEVSANFVRGHAAEMSEAVLRSHIALFVNGYSAMLGERGREAVSRFLGMARSDVFLK